MTIVRKHDRKIFLIKARYDHAHNSNWAGDPNTLRVLQMMAAQQQHREMRGVGGRAREKRGEYYSHRCNQVYRLLFIVQVLLCSPQDHKTCCKDMWKNKIVGTTQLRKLIVLALIECKLCMSRIFSHLKAVSQFPSASCSRLSKGGDISYVPR